MSIVNGSIQIANYTQAEWQAWNGVLKSGQIAISTDQFYGTTNAPKYKVGNGVDTWSNLDYHPDTTGGANTASNGLNVVGSDVQMGGALTKDTTVAGGAFDFQLSGIPKANQTTLFESSQDLFGLQALVGQSINGQGMKYNLTYDGNGDPESWVFFKVSDDANLGFGYNATIGYINLATGEETYFEATPAAVNMLVNNGGLPAGISIDRVTEKVSIGMNGSERLTIDATETKLPPFAGGGTQMLTVDNAGVVGVGAVPSATATVLTLDRFGNTTTGSSADTHIIHRVTTIPANTIANQDIFDSSMFMVKNASSNDTGYFIVLSNTNLGVGSNSLATFGFTAGDSFIFINTIEVTTFLNGVKICYAYLDSAATLYLATNANVFHPYQSAGGAAVAPVSRTNQATTPINWALPVYAHWITSSANAARVRGFEGGYIQLIKAP